MYYGSPMQLIRRRLRWIVSIGLGLWVSLMLTVPSAAIAQLEPQTATHPIVVDGRVLFQVNSSGNFMAVDRARDINQRLQQAIRSTEPLVIAIKTVGKSPTLSINDEHLLTVTDEDVIPGRTAHSQALEWRGTIETALEQAQWERSPSYLRWMAVVSVIILVVTFIAQRAVQRGWQRWLAPYLRHQLIDDPPEDDPTDPADSPPSASDRHHPMVDTVLRLPPLLARLALALACALTITRLFPWTRQWSYVVGQSLISVFAAPSVNLGRNHYSISDLLLLLSSVVVLFILSKYVTDLFRARVLAVTGVNRGAQATISILVRYSLVFFGSLSLMQIWGIDISSLAILASSLGIGIGFGLQDIAKNFGSGLVLVFERPIQVGDFVEVGDFQGTVEHIGARSTLIRTLDQVSIIVPNSRFLENEVINWSLGNPISRIRLPVGVAYGSDIERVRQVFLQAARDHPQVLTTPSPQVFFKAFGDSSLDFEVMVWTAEPSRQVKLKSDLYFAIEALLREHQVEIPFPQRDLHVRSGNLPLSLSPQLERWLQQLAHAPQNGHSPTETLDHSDPHP
jgi:potassium efflux system protein